MSGYRQLVKLRRFEKEAADLGFMLGYPKYSGRDADMVALYPKDKEALPVYSRDAELFIGTIEEAEHWLNGITWARNYDRLLGLSNDEKRAKKENLELQRQLLEKLKGNNEPHDKVP